MLHIYYFVFHSITYCTNIGITYTFCNLPTGFCVKRNTLLRYSPSTYDVLKKTLSFCLVRQTDKDFNFPAIIADYKQGTWSDKTGCPEWLDITRHANRLHLQRISSLYALEEICWANSVVIDRYSYSRDSVKTKIYFSNQSSGATFLPTLIKFNHSMDNHVPSESAHARWLASCLISVHNLVKINLYYESDPYR